MQNIKDVFYNLKRKDKAMDFLCYFIPFLCLGGYLLYLVLNGEIRNVTGYYLIHYLYTYDHGFVGRGLVGEVISWFCEVVTDDVTRNVVIVFSFLLMISATLCIGKALTKVKKSSELFFVVSMLCFILCILPGSFRAYYQDFKLDKILWAITLFSVLLVNKKYMVWFTPILCIIATLINPVFLFCSMILISLILLQEFYNHNFSKKYGVICAVTYVSMILIGIYALVSEQFLGFETPKELLDYYFSRYSGVESFDEEYYNVFINEWIFDYFETSMEVLISKAYQIYFIEWGNGSVVIADLVFLMLPTYCILGLFWKRCMSESKNKFQKFIFFLCMISPLVIIPPIIFSWETSKYYYNNLIVQLSLIIYYITAKDEAVLKTIRNLWNKLKNDLISAMCLVTYFSMIFIYG